MKEVYTKHDIKIQTMIHRVNDIINIQRCRSINMLRIDKLLAYQNYSDNIVNR